VRDVDCLSDLVARARRYRLSQAERIRLDEHLSKCETCRRARQIGADFDAVARLQPGDDKVIADLADRAIGQFKRGTQPRRRARSVSVAAALTCILFSAGAGAAVIWHFQSRSPMRAQSESLPPVAGAPIAESSSAVSLRSSVRTSEPPLTMPSAPTESFDVPSVAPRIVPPSNPKALRPPRAPRAAASHGAAVSGEPGGDTAASLFADANEERRRAHAVAASALYSQLQQRYPSSNEALVSRVSLGRLLLERGAWSDALSQLDRYLIESPDGVLAPEALFGEAQALQALGRREEERNVLARLLARFADSVYAAQARRRMEELR
jgi:hypothetical protein